MKQPLRIGDERRDTGVTETIHSPWDDSPVGEVSVASASDVDDAIAAAADAFDGTRRMPVHRRAAILEGTADRLRARREELATLMARESGKPIRFARSEVDRAVITFTLAAGETRRFGGEQIPVDLEARAEGRTAFTLRVPRGPVAAIAPFNFPLNLIAHKVAPAVAVGASTVLKPPPQCPLTGFVLAVILEEAGLPAGALNVVHCPPETAQRLVEDDRLRVLSFTGSDAVGWKLKALAGRKQVLLELGGNAPCIVDETADLEAALSPIVTGAWAQAGQVCIKVQRLLVQEAVFDRFLERFVAATRELAVGDPLDEATVVGPMIEGRHVARVRGWIEEAVSGGAKVHCGGTSVGNLLHPTVLTGVDPRAKVCREEVFGPVTVVQPFDRFEEALEAANDTRFGLQAGVFTRSLDRALLAIRELDYGGVLVNDVPTFRVDNFPYGGTGDSGIGREGVRSAMEEMTEPRFVSLRAATP